MSIGTDILYIPRLQTIIAKYPSFINKVYTKKELNLAQTYQNPLYFYASRFSAKEAIIKATNGKYDFQDIEILKHPSGRPLPSILTNSNLKIELSLSYDQDYAISMCYIA